MFTYFPHGLRHDVSVGQIDIFQGDAVDGEIAVVLGAEGDRCCHNLGPSPRLKMADLLVEQVR